MKFDEVTKYLGYTVQDKKLNQALSIYAGIDSREVRLKEDDYSCNVVLKDKGIEFIFSDEATFLGLRQPIGEGPLYFSGCILHTREKSGFSVFSESFYKGLFVTDELTKIRNVLGPSDFQKEFSHVPLAWERWEKPGKLSIYILYKSDIDLVTEIQVYIPRRQH